MRRALEWLCQLCRSGKEVVLPANLRVIAERYGRSAGHKKVPARPQVREHSWFFNEAIAKITVDEAEGSSSRDTVVGDLTLIESAVSVYSCRKIDNTFFKNTANKSHLSRCDFSRAYIDKIKLQVRVDNVAWTNNKRCISREFRSSDVKLAGGRDTSTGRNISHCVDRGDCSFANQSRLAQRLAVNEVSQQVHSGNRKSRVSGRRNGMKRRNSRHNVGCLRFVVEHLGTTLQLLDKGILLRRPDLFGQLLNLKTLKLGLFSGYHAAPYNGAEGYQGQSECNAGANHLYALQHGLVSLYAEGPRQSKRRYNRRNDCKRDRSGLPAVRCRPSGTLIIFFGHDHALRRKLSSTSVLPTGVLG